MDFSNLYPPNHLEETSHTLLQRVGRADEDAWRTFVHLYGPVIRYWLRRAGIERSDMPDVFQEVFVAIHRHAAEFQPDPGVAKLRAWLKAITHSKIMDYYRRKGKQPLAPGGTEALLRLQHIAEENGKQEAHEAQGSGDGRPPWGDDELLTWQMLQMLQGEFQPQSWRAFWRTAVDGCSATEVAAELGISAVAVRKAKSRVLQRLRVALANEGAVPVASPPPDLNPE